MADYIRVADFDQLPAGQLLAVETDGHRVCLANTEGEIYAFRDNCSHKDFPLSEGELGDGQVTCAWHGARFDIRTGRALALPAIKPIKTYPVKVEDGGIWVELP